jgi:hypothetical protein
MRSSNWDEGLNFHFLIAVQMIAIPATAAAMMMMTVRVVCLLESPEAVAEEVGEEAERAVVVMETWVSDGKLKVVDGIESMSPSVVAAAVEVEEVLAVLEVDWDEALLGVAVTELLEADAAEGEGGSENEVEKEMVLVLLAEVAEFAVCEADAEVGGPAAAPTTPKGSSACGRGERFFTRTLPWWRRWNSGDALAESERARQRSVRVNVEVNMLENLWSKRSIRERGCCVVNVVAGGWLGTVTVQTWTTASMVTADYCPKKN